jgi:hypothetical protein
MDNRPHYQGDDSAAFLRASLLEEGLSEAEVEQVLAGVQQPSTQWLHVVAVAISLILLLVLPPTGAVVGAWLTWEPVTGASCGLWVMPALVMAGLGGLVGFAVGLGLGVAAVAGVSMWLAGRAS